MKSFLSKTLALFFVCLSTLPLYAEQNLGNAMVKIYTVYTEYDYDMPWQISKQKEKTGSGCVIDGKRILTNAHVIANQRFIQVKHAGEAKKYVAEVEFVAHDCDLAVLKVKDDSFFQGVEPLSVGQLPMMRDRVAVYGFPEGGDELSITEGVVSRIEYQNYAHSNAYLLACQIDAALNSGNSGGPVIENEGIVGVAFQSLDQAENIGYMIPAPVIHHFLKDIEDGRYDGMPSLEGYYQTMENSGLRSKKQMEKNQTGILVTYIPPGSPMEGLVQNGDVVLAIDGNIIENDGTIALREHERVDSDYIVHSKKIGETVQLRILRDSKVLNVNVQLTVPIDATLLVPYIQYDKSPTYFIVGGLVFQPLTANYLSKWTEQKDAPANLVYYFLSGRRTKDQKQVVALTQVLGAKITAGYSDHKHNVITQVNGQRIVSISDLVNAIEPDEGEYHVIVDEKGNLIVLDRSEAKKANQRIMNNYEIRSDRSEDLRANAVR
jgi:S1-C subfamily serine protease